MTRPLLFALALLLAAPAALSQTSIGLRGGLNVSSWSGDDLDVTEPRLGATGGLFARYQASPALALQAEALYSQKGVRSDLVVGDEGVYQLDYIDVPVLARVSVPLSLYADAGVYAGPTISFPIRGEFKADAETGQADFSVKDDLKTTFGLTLGGDYYAGPVGVDLRYTLGLSDVVDPVTFPDDVFGDVKNQVFSVTLGYRFGG